MSYIGSKPANKPVVASDLDPTVITGQTALAVAPADTDEFLISDAGVLKRLDASLISGANTPAFSAGMSGNQTINHASATKVSFNSEIFDTDGCYDPSTNYRFTPTTAGKYYVNLNLFVDGQGAGNLRIPNVFIYKNGVVFSNSAIDMASGFGNNGTFGVSSVITMNGSSDYLEAYAYMYVQDSSTSTIGGSATSSALFSGYKLIGV